VVGVILKQVSKVSRLSRLRVLYEFSLAQTVLFVIDV
jgi:hypothetical protein